MGQSDNTTTIAVLVRDEYIRRWERDVLVSLSTERGLDITHVVVKEESDSSDIVTFVRDELARVREYPLWALVGVARLLSSNPPYSEPASIRSVDTIPGAEWLRCNPESVDEHWNTLPSEVTDIIEEEVDVVIRFGFGMVKGRILTSPTYGVLSFHPGDIRKYRGQPGGFWEFLNGEDETGMTLQRLNETLDGGEIVAFEAIDIRNAYTWQEITRRLFDLPEAMIVPGIRTLTDPAESIATPDDIGPLYTVPMGGAVLKYVVKNTHGRLQRFFDELTTGLSTTPTRAATASILIVSGFLVGSIHFVATHHYVTPIHFELVLWIVLIAAGLALLIQEAERRPA